MNRKPVTDTLLSPPMASPAADPQVIPLTGWIPAVGAVNLHAYVETRVARGDAATEGDPTEGGGR